MPVVSSCGVALPLKAAALTKQRDAQRSGGRRFDTIAILGAGRTAAESRWRDWGRRCRGSAEAEAPSAEALPDSAVVLTARAVRCPRRRSGEWRARNARCSADPRPRRSHGAAHESARFKVSGETIFQNAGVSARRVEVGETGQWILQGEQDVARSPLPASGCSVQLG